MPPGPHVLFPCDLSRTLLIARGSALFAVTLEPIYSYTEVRLWSTQLQQSTPVAVSTSLSGPYLAVAFANQWVALINTNHWSEECLLASGGLPGGAVEKLSFT